jgi:hypothetical protein
MTKYTDILSDCHNSDKVNNLLNDFRLKTDYIEKKHFFIYLCGEAEMHQLGSN